MSANLRVLVPEGTTNYILNPSLRYGTTGWTAAGAAITRVITKARFGIASLKVVTNGSALREGAFYRVSSLRGVNEPITASIYVRGEVGNEPVRIRLIDNPFGNEWYSQPVALKADRWTRLEVSGYLASTAASNDVRLYVETTAVKAVTFYLDGAQIERKAYATTYCDGDQPGCRWNLESHSSLSTREPYTREGGRWVALAGPCRNNDNLYVTALGGLGMPPLEHRTQSWALAPGSFYQTTKVLDRVLTFSFFAKHKRAGIRRSTDLSPLHELRQQLLDLIKPDKTYGGEPFLFEYDAGDRPLYIRLRYEAGLEGEWDIRNEWVNAFPVRFLAVDPIFYEDNANHASLNFITNVAASSTDGFRRVDGAWSSFVLGAVFRALAVGTKGEIYAGVDGTYTVVKWDGTTVTTIGTGNQAVQDIAVAPNGDLYIVGDFTAFGGVAANYVAKYTQATGTWSALGTGLGSNGGAVVVAPNGQVYIGGLFTTAGGATMNRITRWDGTQFRVVGTPNGVNGRVYSLALSRDGKTIYMGGDFTADSAGGVNLFRIAAIDTTTNLIYTYGDARGFNNTVITLAVGADGALYAGGAFTDVGGPGGAPILRIAKSMGAAYSADASHASFVQLGDGLNNTVQKMRFGPDNTLYIGGLFTLSGTRQVLKLAKWVNDTLYPADFILAKTTAAAQVVSMAVHPNGDLYIGQSSGSTASYASARTTVNNSGTAEVKPSIYIAGPGTLRYLENQTTGKKIHFDLTIFSGEEVFIDFAKNTISSPGRGDLSQYILNPSDMGDFVLSPGDNVIAAFMTDDVSSSMKISYIPQHWSADAVVDAEALT